MASLAAVGKKYKLDIPPQVAALYAKRDGERAGEFTWRLHTLAEMMNLDLDDGWLNHSDDGAFVKTLGGVLPLITNDSSDLLVLHVGGPLDGYLSLVAHDTSDIDLAHANLDAFLADRNSFDTMGPQTKPTAADLKAASALQAKAVELRRGEVYAERNARLLRREAQIQEPQYWAASGLPHRLLVVGEHLIASIVDDPVVDVFDKSGKRQSVQSKNSGTPYIVGSADQPAAYYAAEDTAWRLTTDGKQSRLFTREGLGEIVSSITGHLLTCSTESSDTTEVRIWDSASGELVQRVDLGVEGLYFFLALDRASVVVVSASDVRRVLVADGKSTTLASLDDICIARISATHDRICLISETGTLHVVDLKKGKVLGNNPEAHDGSPAGMAILDNGSVVTCSSIDNSIRVHDPRAKTLSRRIAERPAALCRGENNRIYVGFPYRGVARYDVDSSGVLSSVV